MIQPTARTSVVLSLLPLFIWVNAGDFLPVLGERDKRSARDPIKENMRCHQRVFMGVTNDSDPRGGAPEGFRDTIFGGEMISPQQLKTIVITGFLTFC